MIRLFGLSTKNGKHFLSSSPKLPPKLPVVLLENELEEKFIKGSGHGGQAINKAMSCVQLKHIPTGLMVETQRFRELMNNRKEARKLLAIKLDNLLNGEQSKEALAIEKIKRNLAKKRQRAKKKYQKDKDEKSSKT